LEADAHKTHRHDYRRDILSELPFGNRIIVVALSGRDLKAALENGLSAAPSPVGRFPQVSGMAIEVDLKRPPGQRVVAIKVGGAPLNEAKTYTAAVNDYMARGGDGYVVFRDADHLIRDYDGALMANVVMDYVRKLGAVRNAVEGRILAR